MTPEMKGFLLLSVVKMLIVFTIIMIGVALLTLMERKVSAWMQNRRGPNRVGWAGLLQPAADGVKNILKEETFPAQANRTLFLVAPALSFIPALTLSAVIPFAAPLQVDFDFTRRDGVTVQARISLPVGYRPGTRVPAIFWTYPREFEDDKAYGRAAIRAHPLPGLHQDVTPVDPVIQGVETPLRRLLGRSP